jgi:primary-amine oxidase
MIHNAPGIIHAFREAIMKANALVVQSVAALLLAGAAACGQEVDASDPISPAEPPATSGATSRGSRAPSPAQASPLDPLSADEINQVMRVLRAERRISPSALIPAMKLHEPDKSFVLGWSRGQSRQRKAYVVTRDNGVSFEGVVDLERNRTASWRRLPATVQPPLALPEQLPASNIVVSDPEFQQHLRARGIEDFSTVICLPLTAGNFRVPSEQGKRLIRSACLDFSVEDPWSRPIENLTAVVDLDARKVIEIDDTGVVPMSTSEGTYLPAETRPAPRPLITSQPEGVDFTISGNELAWDNWKLHFRVEQRDGLILSRIRYNDHGRERSIVYRASLAELFVPYADPTSNWYYRTFLDEGEFGFGKSTSPLVPNKDCPTNAVFRSVTIPGDDGVPVTIPNAICVFERTPHLAVHHFDIFTNTQIAKSGREIVMRYAAIVGNYDYIFDWTFMQDGTVMVRVGASGVSQAKGTAANTLREAERRGDLLYGQLVDRGLVGANHQHIFNLRLDMDVDGEDNTFVTLTPRLVRAPPPSRRTSAWVVDERQFDRERDARLDDAEGAQLTVVNPRRHNALGYPTGYLVEAHSHTSRVLMADDDPPAQRAAFAQHGVWVTRFDGDQLYAAGDFPNQSSGGDGLPQYIADNANIKNKDIVLWVNIGLTHITRVEDWPLMSVEWFGSIELKPFMFFDRNPGLDISDAE